MKSIVEWKREKISIRYVDTLLHTINAYAYEHWIPISVSINCILTHSASFISRKWQTMLRKLSELCILCAMSETELQRVETKRKKQPKTVTIKHQLWIIGWKWPNKLHQINWNSFEWNSMEKKMNEWIDT